MTDHELIANLLVRAGAIMEDTSLLAVSALPPDRLERHAVIKQIEQASECISALISAAKALAEHD